MTVGTFFKIEAILATVLSILLGFMAYASSRWVERVEVDLSTIKTESNLKSQNIIELQILNKDLSRRLERIETKIDTLVTRSK